MENLILELQLPRTINASAASIRAAKVLQELHVLVQQDRAGRLKAEEENRMLQLEVERLRGLLNEKNNISPSTNASTVGESTNSGAR